MDFEEREKQQRRQFMKVVIAEIGMVIAVVVIVVVTTLASMGFFVGENGAIEQSGLLQIHSIPTGLSVDIDGNTLFSRTNLSRSMAAGEYEITLKRDKYDVWSRKVEVYSGMLVRLYYPRLFLLDRTTEKVRDLGNNLAFYAFSSDHASVLYASDHSKEWNLLDLHGDDVRAREIDLSKVLGDEKETDFSGKVEIAEWSEDGNRVLTKVTNGEKVEWILVDLNNTAQSLNLTKTFGLNFEQVQMMDGAAKQLFVRENQNLRRINTADQAISKVLLNNIVSFSSAGVNLAYLRDDGVEKILGTYRDGDENGMEVVRMKQDAEVVMHLSEYSDEVYLSYIVDGKLTVRYGTVPAYRKDVKASELSDLKILINSQKLKTMPTALSTSSEGEFLAGRDGKRVEAVDFETGELFEYEAPAEDWNWLDSGMMYAIWDDKMEAWDFDFTNRRILVQRVGIKSEKEEEGIAPSASPLIVTTDVDSELVRKSVLISKNNKWLYYLVKKDGLFSLVREKICD